MEVYGELNAVVTPKRAWDKGTPFGWNSWGNAMSDVSYAIASSVSAFFADKLAPEFTNDSTVYIGLDSYWTNITAQNRRRFIKDFFIPFSNPFLRTFCKLLCLPVVVSIGYELIKLCGKYDNVLTRIIAAPGLWFQRLTVKEPTDKMMEAAIAAMKAVIPENGEDIIR